MTSLLTETQTREIVAQTLDVLQLDGKRVLLIVPDNTRTAPVGLLFRLIHQHIGARVKNLDVMIALGTHPPMSEAEIDRRMETTPQSRREQYSGVQFLNHAWDDPNALTNIGTIEAHEIGELSDGMFEMEVAVEINKRVFDYDQLIIVGPVFPHEVVGFSGGNKYLFPGIGGADVLNFFHWLGAVISNPKIIGNKATPVRRVVDKAASMVEVDKAALCMVVHEGGLAGLFGGTPENAWSRAADLSDKLHIVYKEKPFHTVLSCAPPMYDELWVGGKCMYKLEPVVADGGELIIYAPHLKEVSITHRALIERIGYHCSNFILGQWDKYKNEPWGILAHSAHVKGIGTFENGVEKPRVTVMLATGISEETCRKINLGYRDPNSINPADYANREDEGVLVVPKAGEMLYRLKNPPEWQKL